MLTSVLTQLTGLLDKRFTLNALFPALAFALACLLVGYAGASGVDSGISAWKAQDGVVQGGIVVLAVTAVFLFALFLASQALSIVQAYEGYVGPRWLRRKGVQWHEARYPALEYDRQATEYPVPLNKDNFDFLPTRLGNILRSGERYANERYGIDGVVAFPRLFGLLPDSVVTALANTRAQLELTLTLSLLSAVFAVFSGIYLAVSEVPVLVTIGCYAGGAIASYVLYRGSLGFATAYSSQIKAAFDLHRLELLDALKVLPPANRNEEQRRWALVGRLLYRNDSEALWWYAGHDPAGGAAPKEPAAPTADAGS